MTEKSSKENLEEIGLNDFSFSDYQNIYRINKASGKVDDILKESTEVPSSINSVLSSSYRNGEIVKPPWNTYEIEWMLANNLTHRRCMELKATLISGFGYTFRNRNHKNFNKLEQFCKRPNSRFGQTFDKIISETTRNLLSYGYGPIIVKKALDVIKIYPATNTKTMFIKPKIKQGRQTTEIEKYVQVAHNQGRIIEYYPYDWDIVSGRNYQFWLGYKKLRSSYFPEPSYLPVMNKLYEDIFVDKRNLDFFKNRAMGDYIILFSGGKLTPKTKKEVEKKYQENLGEFKGEGNQHKTMVLQSQGKDSKIQILDLSKDEDGQFSNRQSALEYSTARAWGVTPSLVQIAKGGSGFGGGSVATGDLFIENQIMIRPEQHDLETSLNLFLESIFDFDPQIKFRTIDTNNQKDMAVILNQIISSGTPISKIEARGYINEHGLMELEDIENIPTEDDLVVPNSRTQTNIDGDVKGDGSLESDADGINNITEDKFSE